MSKYNRIINDIVNATRGAEFWAPLLTGALRPTDWVDWIRTQPVVTTRNGYEISPARAALNSAQFAMSNLAVALRAATDLNMLPYTQAVKAIRDKYLVMDSIAAAFAALRGEGHRELVVADVTLLVKDGAFDEMRGSEEAVTEEELWEMGLDPEQVEEFLEMQAALHNSRQPELGKDEDVPSDQEGEYRSAIHEPKQLWDIEPRDLKFAELSYVQVALIGQDWPREHPMWEHLEQRLVEAWANTRAFIEQDKTLNSAQRAEALAEHDAKVERRAASLEDLHRSPGYARWAVNHVTRRVWRDLQVIRRRGEQAQAEIDKLVHEDYLDERYQVKSQVVRHRDEGQERWRSADLLYTVIREDEIRHGDQSLQLHSQMVDGRLVQVREALEEGETRQIDADLRYFTEVVMTAGELIEKLLPLYKELVKLETRLAPIWAIFARDGRPEQPPVYWNNRGFYLTEEEAQAALMVELEEGRQKYREAEGDALAKAVALMLQNDGQ